MDDDKHIAELISLYMMKEGYETQEIYDGKEAAAAVEDFQPDLILLDLMLPGMDGYQVCTEVRKTSRVPIIMLTAKGETFDKVLGLELGADDYIGGAAQIRAKAGGGQKYFEIRGIGNQFVELFCAVSWEKSGFSPEGI